MDLIGNVDLILKHEKNLFVHVTPSFDYFLLAQI